MAAKDLERQRQSVLNKGPAAVQGANGEMSKPSCGRVYFGLAMSTELWREFAIARFSGTEEVARMCREAAAQRGGDPRMVRDRSMVRRGGAQSGRNSDVDKRAAAW